MGISEETKRNRNKSSERERRSPGQSGVQGTKERVAYAEPQDRMDQVRDILFGAQREEYDRRFSRLEELLVKNISDLSNDTTGKFGALRDDYDKRLARLEGLLVKNISDLSNDTTKKLDTLSNTLSNSIQKVRQEKVDKAALSELLKQILKLSHDLNVVE